MAAVGVEDNGIQAAAEVKEGGAIQVAVQEKEAVEKKEKHFF